MIVVQTIGALALIILIMYLTEKNDFEWVDRCTDKFGTGIIGAIISFAPILIIISLLIYIYTLFL